MTNPNTQPASDAELREELLYEWLVHGVECTFSMTELRECDCIQEKVATNIMPLITAHTNKQIEAEFNLIERLLGSPKLPNSGSDKTNVLAWIKDRRTRLGGQSSGMERLKKLNITKAEIDSVELFGDPPTKLGGQK